VLPVKYASHRVLSQSALSLRSSVRTGLFQSALSLRSSVRTGLAAALVLLGTGCLGLQLTNIKATQQKPSNVAVYFKVSDRTGEPLGGLTADRFRIYEDDQLVSQSESKQTILSPGTAATHYTLLLVDMSGRVTESGASDGLVQAVGTFADRIGKEQKLGVYAFDGGPDLNPIVPFGDQPDSPKAGVQDLATFKAKTPSTNLNGGVVKALDELDTAIGKSNQPLKFGTLVVFTGGADHANRVSTSDMEQHIREKPFDVYAIELGPEMTSEQLAVIGKSGTAQAADKTSIAKAFDDVAAKVEARIKSYYLLSYCSPARAGKHEVRIEAFIRNSPYDTAQIGSLKTEFDATGFAPGCDPNTPPSFDVPHADVVVPPVPDKDKQDKDNKRKKTEEKKETRAPVKAPAMPPPQPPAPAPAPQPAKPAQPDFNP
jgi:hypothetical protein